jgi:Beta propeller domain
VPHPRRPFFPRYLAAMLLALESFACARPDRVVTLRELDRVVDESTRERVVAFESPEALRDYVERLQTAQGEYHSSLSTEDGEITVYEFESIPFEGELLQPQFAATSANPKLTNTQEDAVDEGGIVKGIGDYLVVMRRGRLFSVDLAGRSARPVDAIDISPRARHDAWYDELLVAGNTAVVVGYSYEVEGTEVLRFQLDASGHWHRRDAWVLRGSDYYSSRNYASRVVDGHLVVYAQSPLLVERGEVALPMLARWNGGRLHRADWTDVMTATNVHQPVQPTRHPVLHVVIDCDLQAPTLRCTAQGIVGAQSRTFYASRDAVYVWVHESARSEGTDDPRSLAAVYRLPLDGSTPGVLRVAGAPIDQFSFKEHEGMLAVLVQSSGRGDSMMGPELAVEGALALMRVPVAAFTTGVADVEPEAFTPLPSPGTGHALVDRFVGDHLLYGEGDPWAMAGEREPSPLHVVRYTDPQPRAQPLTMTHAVERIEALGEHALVVGAHGHDLYLSSIALDDVRVASQHVEPGVGQGETRSHGFSYAPRGGRRGILGLPLRPGEQPGWAHLVKGSSGVAYLRVDDLHLSPLGALGSDPVAAERDDGCETSCIDWYGSARPLFIDDRVFALLGYELVEGRVARGRIEEVDRASLLEALKR